MPTPIQQSLHSPTSKEIAMRRAVLWAQIICAFSTIPVALYAGTVSSGKLTITTSSLPAGTVGVAYSSKIAASGGSTPYIYGASNLPSGLSISSSTGALTGVPASNSVGTKTVAVTVKDSTQPTAQSATLNLSITINAAGAAVSCGNITTGNLASHNCYV